MPMTPQQIQDLTDAFNTARDNPTKANIAAYYDVLDAAGFEYGALARGVVLDNTFAGIFANNFAQNKIVNDKGGTFSGADSLALNLELMSRDFEARGAEGFGRLSGDVISRYHDLAFPDVFRNVPSSQEAWTPYAIVRALNDFEVWRTDSVLDYIAIYKSMWGAYLNGDVNANGWLQDVRIGVVVNLDGSVEFGDGIWTATLREHLLKDNNASLANFFDSEINKFAFDGIGSENAFATGGLELAISDFVARKDASGGSAPSELLINEGGVHSVSLALLSASGQPQDVSGLDIIKTGIKFDLVGEFNLIANPPDEFSQIFQRIDDFVPDALFVQTASATSVETTGTAERDLIIGVSGNGKFDGGAAEDLIYGGIGHDDLLGAADDDLVIEGDGAGLLAGGDGSDLIAGGDGADFLFGADEIDPNASFQDTPAFFARDPDPMQADVFDGGAGNDLIVTAAADSGPSQPAQSVILFGEGDGHDVVYLGLGDIIQIKAGTSITDVQSTTRNLEILFEDSPVALKTNGGDTLLVASGYNSFDSSDISKVAVQFLDGNGAVVDAWTLEELANRVGDLATFEAFPDSYLTAYDDHFDERASDDDPNPADDGTAGADTLVASAGVDFIIARAGADTVDGLGGNDTIRGGAGTDVIDGGAGDDTIDGGSGRDTITGGAGRDVLDGGAGNDVYLVGDSDADVYRDLLGGRDTIRFLPGVATGFLAASFSRAASGIDVIDGTQAGAVVLRGADPLTALDWDFTRMDVAGIAAIEGGGGADRITGSSAADVVRGAGGADVLTGGAGSDDLDGGGGDDVLAGGFGNDLLRGGFGSDSLDGGAGIDTASYEGATQALTLDLAAGSASGGAQIGSDGLSGIENVIGGGGNDVITGDGGANELAGGAGDDRLTGAAGEDVLRGGDGDDVLTGGPGSDTFFFEATGQAGADTITDFDLGPGTGPGTGDVIDVSLFGFADFAALSANFSQVGADTVIDLGASESVRLVGIASTDLQDGHFII